MKVLTIMSRLEMGGIEKTLLSCIPLLKDRGVVMSVLCSLGGALDEDYRRLGVELIDIGGNKKPFKDANFLKKVLLKNKFDIVHSRYGHTSGAFAKVCYDLNIPFLISIHNERAMFRNSWQGKFVLESLRNLYLNYHRKLSLKYATKIIGHSKANLKYFDNSNLQQREREKLVVLYNGVDFSKLRNSTELEFHKELKLKEFIKDKSKVFIHIGSFKEQKNHSFLIEVLNKLLEDRKDYGLILLGIGSLMSSIKDLVRKYGLVSNVLFVGMETNIAPYLKAADIFFFPSLYEGFGNVLIEAQYANVAIAASDIAPHYEASFERYHSYFYNPLDVNDAVKKISLLVNEDKNILREAKQFANVFSIENMVENMVSIYNEVLNEDN